MGSLIQGALLLAICWSAVAAEPEAWLSDLERVLTKAYRLPDTDRLELSAVKPPSEPGFVSGPGRLEVVGSSLPPLGPRLVLRCQRLDSGRVLAESVVRLEAKVMRKVWVPVAGIPRDRPLGTNVVEESRDVCGLGGVAFQGDLDGGRWVAAESLRPGVIILTRQVAPAPIVRRGQALEGILSQGPMNIRLGVTALEMGAQGQLIRVRNSTSLKELKGKVVDEKTIQIQL